MIPPSKPITPLPFKVSPILRRINRKLNARGFVLRKRRAYIIEPMEKVALRANLIGRPGL